MSHEIKQKIEKFKSENGNSSFTTKEMTMLLYTELKEMQKDMVGKPLFYRTTGFLIGCLGGLLVFCLKLAGAW